jgi:arsenate reductase-like glutaredoxin family protein
MKKIYHLSTCSTNIRILSDLNLQGVELQDIKSDAITEEQLEQMRSMTDSYEKLFSKRARKYKEYGLKDKNLSEADFKMYILEDYTFLNRPVAVIDDKIFIGNSKKNVEALKLELEK